ncbi:hypothetical protein VTO42DRAFT_7571 [Malbranchea cinnamomea]
MELPPDVRDRYIQIIDDILSKSDLNTVSEKRIRRGLQDAIGQDLTHQKAVIKELIMQRFDIFAERQEIGAASSTNANGNANASSVDSSSSPQPQKRDADDHNSETIDQSPPAKKQKSNNDTVDLDAILAAKLQAEENLRARPTRGAAARKAAPVQKKKAPSKAKGSKKISPKDDSDLDHSGSEPKKVNRSGGFHKPLNLSPALAALLNETSLSRPQTVKKVWEYIREHQLQDPTDKRHIICDDPMRAVFKQDRVHMFTMNKILSQNLYNPDE